MENNEKYNFKQAKFYITVNDINDLPNTSIKEIAIAGRSNVGKSSLLNTLANQNRLAFTSKTPGRTQHINYFTLDNAGSFLVDLPGYGYAKVPESVRAHWVNLLGNYLSSRSELIGLVLMMDSRHPLKELDYRMLKFFSVTKKPIHIVLSKVDKINNQERAKVKLYVENYLSLEGFGNYTVSLFSSLKKIGVEELERVLNYWLK